MLNKLKDEYSQISLKTNLRYYFTCSWDSTLRVCVNVCFKSNLNFNEKIFTKVKEAFLLNFDFSQRL